MLLDMSLNTKQGLNAQDGLILLVFKIPNIYKNLMTMKKETIKFSMFLYNSL